MKQLKNLSLVMVLVLSLGILAACGNNTTTPPPATPPATPPVTAPETPGTGEEMEFTAAELAEFDGKDGNRAYVAVDGIVYDVTDVPAWNGGEHQGRVTAGMDLSDEIENMSPHGKGVLEDLPVVGVLVE